MQTREFNDQVKNDLGVDIYNNNPELLPENEEEFIAQCLAILNELSYKDYQKGCQELAEAFDRKQIALQVLETITTN